MSRKIWHLKIEVMMQREQSMNFPDFIKQLRNMLGFTRKVVCDDTGISKAKLLDLEHGHFSSMPKLETLKSLAEYYEIPFPFLKKKCIDFCSTAKKEKRFQSFAEKYPEITLNEELQHAV